MGPAATSPAGISEIPVAIGQDSSRNLGSGTTCGRSDRGVAKSSQEPREWTIPLAAGLSQSKLRTPRPRSEAT